MNLIHNRLGGEKNEFFVFNNNTFDRRIGLLYNDCAYLFCSMAYLQKNKMEFREYCISISISLIVSALCNLVAYMIQMKL